jgi:hypothetical protein
MVSNEGSPLAPSPPKLSAHPSTSFWTADQWAVLLCLVEAALPPVVPASQATDKTQQMVLTDGEFDGVIADAKKYTTDQPVVDKFVEYLQYSPTQDPSFIRKCERTISIIPNDTRNRLGSALSALA